MSSGYSYSLKIDLFLLKPEIIKYKEDVNDKIIMLAVTINYSVFFLRRFYAPAGYQIDSTFVWKCSLVKD